jgi:SAM-dependent methyltransferase
MNTSPFDQYAADYESALQQGLSVSGESSEYFAINRVRWLRHRLKSFHVDSSEFAEVLDFGCGTGNSVPYLLSELSSKSVVGVDTSEQSLVQARSLYRENATFVQSDEFTPTSTMELAYCNGVFHHIPLELRDGAIDFVFRSLKPGGWFAFWENNPWNPGTQYVMSRIPFDRDAIKISIPNAKKLLVRNGFEIKSVDSLFYFPKFLGWFRPIEQLLTKLPFGAQYMVLATKPTKSID